MFILNINADNGMINLNKKLMELENKLSCLNLNKGNPKKITECLKKRTEEEIENNYNDGVQIFISYDEDTAHLIANDYNKFSRKVTSLKKSKAKIIMIEITDNVKKYNKRYRNLLNKETYFVVVYQNDIQAKTLKNNIKKIYKDNYRGAIIFKRPRVFIKYNPE